MFIAFKWATCRRQFIFVCVSITPQLSKNSMSTPSLPRRPFSIKGGGHLDTPSKVQMYEYSEDDYLMISHGGVLSVCQDESDFMTLERWEEEYNYHCKLICIPFFALFKKWKPFYVWRTKVRAKKIHLARESLRNRLFIVSQVRLCVYILRSGSSLNLL